jgi:hypothetical protein
VQTCSGSGTGGRTCHVHRDDGEYEHEASPGISVTSVPISDLHSYANLGMVERCDARR